MKNLTYWVRVGARGFLLARSWLRANQIAPFNTELIDGVIYRGFQPSDKIEMSNIYSTLNNGAQISRELGYLIEQFGASIILVAEPIAKSRAQIAGINIYYFNKRDLKERTIHEGFIGVIPEKCGRGIATQMREMAKRHYLNNGFAGISTRISLSNVGSMRSAIKSGFTPLENYRDPRTNEERCYMVCRLSDAQLRE